MQRLIILTLAVLCCVALSNAQGPVKCKESSECGTNSCCMVGRFSGTEPVCVTAPGSGDPCRPGQTPSNQTIYDNENKPLYWAIVYLDVCPCAEGLSCDRASGGTCQ